MSTDGEAPLTRAQLRALRAAAEAAEPAQEPQAADAAEPSRAEESRHAATSEEATAAPPAAPPTIRHPVPAPGIVPRPAWRAPASQHPEQPHPAPATTDAGDLPRHTPGADTPDVGPIRGIRPESGVSAPDLGAADPAEPVTDENASDENASDENASEDAPPADGRRNVVRSRRGGAAIRRRQWFCRRQALLGDLESRFGIGDPADVIAQRRVGAGAEGLHGPERLEDFEALRHAPF